MIREAIKQELIKLKDFISGEKLKSFVFFNVSEEKEKEIQNVVSEEFKVVEDFLRNQRKDEIRELLKQADWVNDKYFELLDRYEGTSVKQEIFGWADDAYKREYNRLISTPTALNSITSELNLQIVNIVQFFEDKKQLDALNDTLDFGNLFCYHYDEDFSKRYIRTADEKRYDDLTASTHAVHSAKYVYCNNIDLQAYLDDFEKLFSGIFKWDYIYWSVFCLPVSQADFEAKASAFLRTELYYNRSLIDVENDKSVNI